MANQYLINFLLRGHVDPIEFEVREKDWIRAQGMFDHAEPFYRPVRFLIVDSVDGLTVAISLPDVQSVRFLCDPVEFPSDLKHKEEEICVWLRGRDVPIKIAANEEKDSLFAFFVLLDSGTEHTPYSGFTDVDGELALFNVAEVVLATAPLHEIKEGHQLLRQDGELEIKGDLGAIPF